MAWFFWAALPPLVGCYGPQCFPASAFRMPHPWKGRWSSSRVQIFPQNRQRGILFALLYFPFVIMHGNRQMAICGAWTSRDRSSTKYSFSFYNLSSASLRTNSPARLGQSGIIRDVVAIHNDRIRLCSLSGFTHFELKKLASRNASLDIFSRAYLISLSFSFSFHLCALSKHFF